MNIDVNQAARLLCGEARRNRIICPGPGHSKADRSMTVTFNNDGTFITHSFAGDDFKDCRDHVKARLGLSDNRPIASVNLPSSSVGSGDEAAKIRAALRLWHSAVPIAGTPVAAYLASRELSYDGEALRFRPTCGSMVALITDALTDQPIGVHRTRLHRDGRPVQRKDGTKARLIYGRAAGGCVRLYDLEPPFGLGIAEGIETALAAPFRPVWACISASVMTAFPVIPYVSALTVFADHDRAGINAANAVGQAWHQAGKEVTLMTPPMPGTDFADWRAA
ncbi:DUF7146 domain-containing protein [Gellertiella hungarica]|uniref:Virulence-associated protein E n=1 Tax=Gellertiella hungarica TaxID=1572859 RepID=A0A7W6J9T4_9HYPH|nr:toprim domain-containing protein [Gellertiella hungarica]MBB4067422.1 hypothetical protein [Gellertiella hungarica]